MNSVVISAKMKLQNTNNVQNRDCNVLGLLMGNHVSKGASQMKIVRLRARPASDMLHVRAYACTCVC